MNDILNNALNIAKEFWGKITFTQRVFMGGAALVVIAMFIGLMFWLNQTEFDVLYANIGKEDANRVIQTLEKEQVPFRLEQEGRVILVPKDRVHQLRIAIAGQNILTGQGIGFEIFDELKVGQTDFVQQLNYRRALEGELARTIMQFPSVESARVHLVIPRRSLFIEEQQSPSASVLLKLAPKVEMKQEDIMAVINLVTLSVAGLDKDHVSVADTMGNVLFEPDQQTSLFGLSRTQLEHRQAVQKNLERRIEELLIPILGPDHIIAKVNAELDFSQKTIRRELFDPERTVVRSEQRSEESTQGQGNIGGGVPDPNFRGDGFTGSTSTQTGNREQRTTNYEINREEYNIVSNVGGIERLSVAVVVDGLYTTNPDGKKVFTPRSDEEIARIRDLVANAVGFNSSRGDTIEVSSMSFGMNSLEAEIKDPLDAVIADYAMRFGKPLMNMVLVFLFLLLVVRPVVLALIRPKVEGKMLEGLEGLPQPEEMLAIEEAKEAAMELEAAELSMSIEGLEEVKAHALQLSEQNMDQALLILKGWLYESNKPALAR